MQSIGGTRLPDFDGSGVLRREVPVECVENCGIEGTMRSYLRLTVNWSKLTNSMTAFDARMGIR